MATLLLVDGTRTELIPWSTPPGRDDDTLYTRQSSIAQVIIDRTTIPLIMTYTNFPKLAEGLAFVPFSATCRQAT